MRHSGAVWLVRHVDWGILGVEERNGNQHNVTHRATQSRMGERQPGETGTLVLASGSRVGDDLNPPVRFRPEPLRVRLRM